MIAVSEIFIDGLRNPEYMNEKRWIWIYYFRLRIFEERENGYIA